MSVPMIDLNEMRVRIDLIAPAVRNENDIAVGLTTYRTRLLGGAPEFVVMVDDWGVAQFVGELALRCAELGLVKECRALLAEAHMTQLPSNSRSVLSFEGWTLVTDAGVEVPKGHRSARRGA